MREESADSKPRPETICLSENADHAANDYARVREYQGQPFALPEGRVAPGRYPIPMILELAILNIRDGTREDFEAAFRAASPIIAAIPGYISHEIRPCIEMPNRYVLLVQWRQLEDHTIGFRQSASYQRWRALLHHFYEPFPTVEHYGPALALL